MAFEGEIDDILAKKDKKKRINSKQKGNRSELKICKILTEHFQKPFNRVPNSGAFGTSHTTLENNARDILAGDIITPEGFLLVIENKNGYDIDLINLFSSEDNGHKKLFFDFIRQACRDAKRTERLPMVIYTKDRRPTLACLPALFFKDIIIGPTFHFQMNDENFPEWQKWSVVSLEELLEHIPKESFYKSVISVTTE